MTSSKHIIVLIFFWLVVIPSIIAQDRFDVIEEKLNQLAENYPGVNDNVELSMSGASIQEFVRAIGTTNNLNVNVDPSLDIKLSNNFNKVSAKDVFIFLCKRYDLDILFVGPIITFTKYSPPPQPIVPKPVEEHKLNIKYDATADLISYDLKGDTLSHVTREITKQSGKNIIFSPELANKVVSGYMQSAPFTNALEKLAFANDMRVSVTPDDFFVFEKKSPTPAAPGPDGGANSITGKKKTETGEFKLKVEGDLITMETEALPISDIVAYVSKILNKNYFLFSELKGNATLKVRDATYENFLTLLFNGTDITFKREGETYLFGERNLEGLRVSKLITLKNRTIEKMLDYIPADLKKGVELKIFEDLNGIIASGSQPRITELEAFVRQLDIVVPMIHIEVIIANVQKQRTLATGISAGLGTVAAPPPHGSLLPDYNISLNAESINNLISGINGFGVINLGNVTPNFYLNLKAMEADNVLKLRSTPQIATLNGHEAKLSIGQTQYYLEVNNNLVNTAVAAQNILQTQNWKPVNADLSLMIDPQVSGDEQITMTINVTQSTFLGRVAQTAPPGTTNRDFQSLVRVRNGDMIMLGGLSENENSQTGKGLPLLSRIPILKWIFGERSKTKRDDKLTIFIKPTVIYN
jgi:type IV pilus assembly protein PilQ